MMMINILGFLLIALIIWWFWLYTPSKASDASVEKITVIVNNGIYEPSRIKLAAQTATTLSFLRKDGSPCASTVIFPDFDMSEELPLDNKKSIIVPPLSPGKYPFHCPMKMYTGTLIVE